MDPHSTQSSLISSVCSVVRMFKHKKCGGEGKFNFIQDFVQNPKLKVMFLMIGFLENTSQVNINEQTYVWRLFAYLHLE